MKLAHQIITLTILLFLSTGCCGAGDYIAGWFEDDPPSITINGKETLIHDNEGMLQNNSLEMEVENQEIRVVFIGGNAPTHVTITNGVAKTWSLNYYNDQEYDPRVVIDETACAFRVDRDSKYKCKPFTEPERRTADYMVDVRYVWHCWKGKDGNSRCPKAKYKELPWELFDFGELRGEKVFPPYSLVIIDLDGTSK